MKVTDISITSWQKTEPVGPIYPDTLIYIWLGLRELVPACVRSKQLDIEKGQCGVYIQKYVKEL